MCLVPKLQMYGYGVPQDLKPRAARYASRFKRSQSQTKMHRGAYRAAMRVASPDSPKSQSTSEMTETRVVIETVDATIISSQ
jgi:hypothetical protein